jgi:GT2 family glycosyltransferase
MSRVSSANWGALQEPKQPLLDVLVPTRNRAAELAVTLAGLAGQDEPDFAVVVSDQSDGAPDWEHPAVAAMVRVLEVQGRPVRLTRHLPRQGMSEHRQFLLDCSSSAQVLFVDNDVWLEPGSLQRMSDALTTLDCGFVGMAVQGLSYLADDRPAERATFELWSNGVHPERIRRTEPGFSRWPLHNAANPTHLSAALDLGPDEWRAYRIAWLGGCVLYDRARLVQCGGFDFWDALPPDHSGEDVAAQWRVMEKYGGAGILPTGAVHLESPTTLPHRPVEAFDVVFPPAPANTG